MLFLFLLGLAVSAVSTAPEEVALLRRDCPRFMFSFHNRCFKYVATHMSWDDADLHCSSEGTNLVSIHSRMEQRFVKLLIRNFDTAEGPTWIGLNDAEEDGTWLCFHNRCFKYVATHMSWDDADLHCSSQGANLVSIHSRMEEEFVKLLIRNFDTAEGPT
ncbi:galactose-specific lectin nattectin-like [Xenentodon cancila]